MVKAEVYFDLIFRDIKHSVNVRAIATGKPTVSEFVLPKGILLFAERFKDRNIYFGCATRNGGGGKEYIQEIPVLWVDVDFKSTPTEEANRLIQDFHLPPTFVVKSGGGYHVYWLLKEPAGPEDIPRVEAILRGLALALHGDRAVTDASHIMRVPGSFNVKDEYGEPRLVQILRAYPERQYNLSDFDHLATDSEPTVQGVKSSLDIQTTVERCAFLKHCEDDAETLPEPEWYAWTGILARVSGGVDYVQSVSSKFPRYSRRETEAKILHALNDAGPRTCAAIKELWNCGRDCGVKSPAVRALKEKEQEPAKVDPRIIILEQMHPRTLTELLMDTTLSEPEPVLKGLLSLGELLTFCGPPKVMKSWSVMRIGLDLASGSPWLGFPAPRPFRVIYISAEGREVRLRSRVQTLIGFSSANDDALDRFSYVTTMGRLKIDTDIGERALMRWVEGFDVVILDPLYRFIAEGDENSHRDQRRVQDLFDRIKDMGKAVIVVHHTRKAGTTDAGIGEIRGAGLDGFTDSAIILRRKKEGTDERFVMSFDVRNDEPVKDMELRREGVVLLPAESALPLRELLDILKAGELRGTAIHETLKDRRGVSKATAERTVGAALEADLISWRSAPGPGQGRFYFLRGPA